MQKSYLLLRDNQQSGPYSLDEVKQLPLRPKDLIWIIGQSAGWRFPEEIEDLKQIITVSPDTCSTPSQPPVNPIDFPSTQNTDAQVGQRVYVSMPGERTTNVSSVAATSVLETATPSFEERVEKMRQRVASVQTPVKDVDNAEAEIKYSRSLEDIKDEYATWLYRQKHKRNVKIEGRHLIAAALFIGTAALSFWMVRAFYATPSTPLLVQNASINAQNEKKVDAEHALTGKFSTAAHKTVKRIGAGNVKRATVSSLKQTQRKQPLRLPDQTANMAAKAPIIRNEASTTNVIPALAVEEPAINVAKDIQVTADIIASYKQKGMGGLAVTVKNNSTQPLKVIAVNVIYFTDAMKEIDRKTVYFSNVSPGVSITRNAPAHKKAEGAFAQLGLVSTEKGGIFYASNK